MKLFLLLFALPLVYGWQKCLSGETGDITKLCGTNTWPTIDWSDGRKSKEHGYVNTCVALIVIPFFTVLSI